MTIPLITQQFDDLTVAENSAEATFDLSQRFDDPFSTGQIARFELVDSSLAGGVTDVLLFDQEGAGAPESVANFLNYVTDGDYAGSIIHRSVPGFIVQGGGFTVDSLSLEESQAPTEIPADPPVVNEFSTERSNTRGTIAFAKLGNDPNSATNQWFFNLADNSENLDNQNGGFTVFGEVLSDEDLAPFEAIAGLPTINGGGAFGNLPFVIEDEDNSSFVGLNSVTLLQEEELEFSVIGNSNPDLVEAIVTDGELSLSYASDQSGEARITVQATNLLGDSVEDRFIVSVGDVEPDLDPEGSTVYRFLNRDTGVHLYTTSEVERASIEDNLPNYNSEGGAFFAFAEQQEGTFPVYRFLNTDTGAHFYTPSEAERQSVEDTLPNYESEGIAYYTFPIEE